MGTWKLQHSCLCSLEKPKFFSLTFWFSVWCRDSFKKNVLLSCDWLKSYSWEPCLLLQWEVDLCLLTHTHALKIRICLNFQAFVWQGCMQDSTEGCMNLMWMGPVVEFLLKWKRNLGIIARCVSTRSLRQKLGSIACFYKLCCLPKSLSLRGHMSPGVDPVLLISGEPLARACHSFVPRD